MLNTAFDILQVLPRIFVLMAVLFAPIMALEMLKAEPYEMFEAQNRNSGAGFVIMVSLQRS